MNVNLGEYFENYITGLVGSGLYQSQSEVVREGLRLLKEKQQLHDLKIKNLRKAVDEGMTSLKSGKALLLDSDGAIDHFFDGIVRSKKTQRMKLVIAPSAAADLQAIYDYIAEDNPGAAKRLLANIKGQFKYICAHPEIGPARSYIRKGLRCIPVGNYMIYYITALKDVTVIRVLHAAQDVENFNTPL